MVAGEMIHCTDGYKNEVHPAIDSGDRDERVDGCYHFIKWLMNDRHAWVHESRLVVLSKKRQRSKTQRWSGEHTSLPLAKKARSSEKNTRRKSAPTNRARSVPAAAGRGKQSPKAPARRAIARKTVNRKDDILKPSISEISMHSDDKQEILNSDNKCRPRAEGKETPKSADTAKSEDFKNQKNCVRKLMNGGHIKPARRCKPDGPGKYSTAPIDLCSDDDDDKGKADQTPVEENASSNDEESSFSSIGTQEFCSSSKNKKLPSEVWQPNKSVRARRKLIARKTVHPAKDENCNSRRSLSTPSVSCRERPLTPVFLEEVDSRPSFVKISTSADETIFPDKVDKCPDVARLPTASKSLCRSNRPATNVAECVPRRRIHSTFYQSDPLKSTLKRYAASTQKGVGGRRTSDTVTLSRRYKRTATENRGKLPAIRKEPRWTARSLRNVNRYSLDPDRY